MSRSRLAIAILLAGCVAVVATRLVGPLLVRTTTDDMEVTPGSDATTLVVAIHGFGGLPSREGLLNVARAAYPRADILAPLYNVGRLQSFSNQNPYAVADVLESTIDDAFRQRHYD